MQEALQIINQMQADGVIGEYSRAKLDEILRRHNLEAKWNRLLAEYRGNQP